jgi:hypothetical protein
VTSPTIEERAAAQTIAWGERIREPVKAMLRRRLAEIEARPDGEALPDDDRDEGAGDA